MSDEHRDEQGRLTRYVTKNGRGVLIYRQYKERDGVRVYSDAWTRRIVRNGRQYYFTLQAKREKAEQTANAIEAFLETPGNTIEQAVARFAPDKLDVDGNTETTIGDILEVFRAKRAALDISEGTADGYVDRLMWFVRAVKAHRAKKPVKKYAGMRNLDFSGVLSTPVAFLDGAAVADFKTLMVESADGDQALEMVRKRSANSTLRNARAIFSESARAHYSHLKLPDISAFVTAKPFRKVSRKYILPPVEVIRSIFREMIVLRDGDGKREPDRNAYVALLLAVFAGLRKKEIAHARRSWIGQDQGGTLRHRLNVKAEKDFLPKAREAGHTELTDWALREILATSRATPYLLEGTATERTENVFDRLNAWLRDRGMPRADREHPVHEMRKLFGSWVASKFGLFVAKEWLRHASVTVTEQTYASLIVASDVLALWDPERETEGEKRGDSQNLKRHSQN